jgi:hypothetical protein
VKLTDTQLVLLSAASRRDDRTLERPSSLTGGAAGKVVARLLADGCRFGGAMRIDPAPCASPGRAFRPSG